MILLMLVLISSFVLAEWYTGCEEAETGVWQESSQIDCYTEIDLRCNPTHCIQKNKGYDSTSGNCALGECKNKCKEVDGDCMEGVGESNHGCISPQGCIYFPEPELVLPEFSTYGIIGAIIVIGAIIFWYIKKKKK